MDMWKEAVTLAVIVGFVVALYWLGRKFYPDASWKKHRPGDCGGPGTID